VLESVDPGDHALVERLRGGDEQAFDELVRGHAARLRATAQRLLGAAEADDALQDGFLAVFRALDGFRGEARLSTWMHRIVVNACLARLRKRGGFDASAGDDAIDPLLPRFVADGHRADVVPPWSASAEDIATRAELRACVRRAIESLPDPHRTILLLRDIEEVSTREAAQMLGLQENAVKVRLHRARQALRTLLEREFAGGAP
jgi:RNA polymerase sigma-70 factor (ECF subfamily)